MTVYIIKGETGQAYNGTLDDWFVGATHDLEEAKDWCHRANEYLIENNIHTSSKATRAAYKRDWKMWFDPEFRNTYNGATYYWYEVPELENRFV